MDRATILRRVRRAPPPRRRCRGCPSRCRVACPRGPVAVGWVAWAMPRGGLRARRGMRTTCCACATARRPVAVGMSIATLARMTSPHLAVDTADEILSRRRAADLLVLDQVRLKAWDRLLFVECGDGSIAEEASRRALRAYACGLDRSPAHVALARQLREVPAKLEFKTWDGRRLPCPERGFDRVVATLALAGAQDPRPCFKRCAESCGRQARCTCSTPFRPTPSSGGPSRRRDLQKFGSWPVPTARRPSWFRPAERGERVD
jgi:hypothetical protein